MIIQTIIAIAFILILFNLGSALFHIVRRTSPEQSEKTVKALTWRISLSIVLFLFLFIAIATGLLKPHGIGSAMHMKKPAPTENAR